MGQIRYESDPKTIQDLVNLYEKKQLNLNPGFQRRSVWTKSDRAKLIDSILCNYPLPNIFLYKRVEDGHIIYDVIDGKQRIESVLMFMGILRNRFFTISQIDDDGNQRIDWKMLRKKKSQDKILGYKVQTIEVSGELGDIINLFVRINSTGKALTPAEKRHAKFYNSEFLKAVSKIAEKYIKTFIENRILSKNQISRMKHIELVCETMLSIYYEGVINKKSILDKVMEQDHIKRNIIEYLKEQFRKLINRLNKMGMFPIIKTTRFHQLSDFYTLAVLIWKFEKNGYILNDKKRNSLACDLLRNFSNYVDKLRDDRRKLRDTSKYSELYKNYCLTVLENTDEKSQRQKREDILRGILESLFEKKDEKRFFTKEQRRIIWNREEEPLCSICKKPVTWEDFQADHIKPHSLGGKTDISNAAITCKSCNAKKGNKRINYKNKTK